MSRNSELSKNSDKKAKKMKRKKYIMPSVNIVTLDSELMAPTLFTGSVGSLKNNSEQKQFISNENFLIVTDKKYVTEDERKFWDDWENGAD